MTQTDPIGDMLTRIRNGIAVHRDWVSTPPSKLKRAVLELLKKEGFISDYHLFQEEAGEVLRVRLLYDQDKQSVIKGLRRISKPGLRVYVDKKQLPRFYGVRGLSVISTSKGLLSGQDAWRRGIGGEVLCYVW